MDNRNDILPGNGSSGTGCAERKLHDLERMAKIGSWSADFGLQLFYFSDFIGELFDTPQRSITFTDFSLKIHPDYRETINSRFLAYSTRGYYDEIFPIKTRFGYSWVHSKMGGKHYNDDGILTAEGYIQVMDPEEVAPEGKSSALMQLRDLISRQNSVSQNLLSLLKNEDSDRVVRDTLSSLLYHFNGDRVYIFEYDWEAQTHSCVYEVSKQDVNPEIESLQHIPISESRWWTQRLIRQTPIIINDLDDESDLPADAEDEWRTLSRQGIRSLMAVPLVGRKGIWGYMGIDVVGQPRLWSNSDQQWFISLAHIISICIELSRSEATAQKEREHFSNLYQHMPLGYMRMKMIYDDQGKPVDYRYLEINPAFEMQTGRTVGEFLGKTAREAGGFVDPDLLSDMENVVRNGMIVEEREDISTAGRHYRTTLYSLEKGEVIGLFSNFTDRLKAAAALSKSQKTLENLYRNIPVGIEIYDKDGILLDVNEREGEIFGFGDKQNVLGVNIFDNPNMPVEALRDLKDGKNIECELIYNFSHLGGYYDSRLNGERNLLVRGTTLYNDDHEVENYLLIVIDNTESYQVHHQLQEFERLFSSIAEFAEIGLCRWEPLEQKFFGSDQWFNNLNQPYREIRDIREAYTNMHPDDLASVQEFFDNAVAGKADTFRKEIRIHNGQVWKWLRCNFRVRRSGSGKLELTGLNIDITELKQTETMLTEAKVRAEESDRLKSAFLANMSHEIRTPLNAIVGFSDLLTTADDAGEKMEYISIIRKNNDLLLQLISDILDLSKIEAGVLETTYGEVDVNLMCSEIVTSYRVNDLPVELLFDATLPVCSISSDFNRIKQVISNFINNAVKFTHQGSIRLGYRILGEEIEFSVQDTGVGISPQKLETVFERFIKLDSFVPGTGLGLSICKSIVEKLGGRIGVESEEGKGSRFWFTLPYSGGAPLPEQKAAEPILSKKEVDDESRRPLILVAEDTDSNYLLISTILKKQYDLLHAWNGVEALDLHRSASPDLILMDIKMPEMDGLTATRTIRETDTTTPIVALTAFAFDSDRQKAFDAGCNDYMTKPVSPGGLKDMIARLLGKQ